MNWELVDSGKKRAGENMACDHDLLLSLKDKPRPILHLYDWEKESATYGHFIKPSEHLNMEGVKRRNLDLAKRPTGGGIVFHIADLAFSVLIPAGHSGYHENTLKNYHWVNERLQGALKPFIFESHLLPTTPAGRDATFHFCMAKPTVYDVMACGQKVGGAAIRRMRFGYLYQGTISLGRLPEQYLADVLLPGTDVLEAMRKLTFSLLPEGWTRDDLDKMRKALKSGLINGFMEKVTC